MYTQTVSYFAGIVAEPGASLGEPRALTFVLHSGGGLLVLLVTTTLAVYKPRGITRYGRRKQREQRALLQP
jgi:hypothetical protein